ncbi:MAG TPA: hypothetical protein VFP84_37805 [Kofleriaceae bacterium]|nr:hypothetical protein [Kofleriaceae bacterium]
MNKLVSVALTLPLAACVIGSDSDPTTPDPGTGSGASHEPGAGTGYPTPTNPGADHITASTTWSGTMALTKATVIDPGVTVTVQPGTTITMAPSVSVTINGTLDVQGTKAAPVNLAPTAANGHNEGFFVATGGTFQMAYGVQVGGGINVNGGSIKITDSKMSQSAGDLLVISAGNVDVSYSTIGVDSGGNTTHCDMHFGGAGTSVKITHSNINTSSYGLMLYAGNNVDLTFNNWSKNTIQVDTSPGVSGDVSNGWFDSGAPKAGPGATITAANLSPTKLTDAGPR